MSPREKKLLTFFAIAGFAIVNLIGLSIYKKKSAQIEARLQDAEQSLQRLELFAAESEQSYAEMEWLQQHLPEPAEYENVQTALQAYCNAEAKRFRLEVKDWDPLKRDDLKGNHFDRVGFRYRVTGMEEDLYRWLDRINMPTQLRASTKLILSPNKEDDTKIDCTAIIEQWFVPVTPTA